MTQDELAARPASGGLLIIGRRTNVNVTDLDSARTLSEVAHKKGTLFITNAEDYFITTKSGMPWHVIPDLVIGRPGYDNWLVARAIDWKATVVDASDAVLAVHQTGSDGNLAGWSTSDETLCINRNIVGEFDYRPGHSKCCPHVAQKDISGVTRIFRRNQISKDCFRIGRQPKGKDAKCI
ncbi:hypothetical protein CAPTEDRAFT_228774 [Capitella teleta]|uniref:Uncharacterized protein n=1 Tax=Capitella teleta TaxID=283909 RepID=R7TAE9_CAPTE|nr:hypothetical protein CAPTEDRAFT_228774 [Capitella teleta]|eukprot:ELT90708.1 hypothetical protein CAPTEDRAFT_228774 [Capitella teleta]